MTIQSIITGEEPVERTFNVASLLHARVLSHQGMVLGRVVYIGMHPSKLTLEGILISQGIFKEKLYIGKGYIQSFSEESVVLTIDPTPLLVGRRVVAADGQTIGKVDKVSRVGSTNKIDSLIVKSWLHKPIMITKKQIQSLGPSIVLSPKAHVTKKYFWQKSE